MRKLQNKIFIYIMLIGSLLIFWTSFIYYNYEKRQINEQLNEETKQIVNRLSNVINKKTNQLQNTIDILFSDSELQSLIRNTDFFDTENLNKEDYSQLDKILGRFFNIEQELESLVMVFNQGGTYVAGKPLEQRDLVRFRMDYGSVGGNANIISWLGTNSVLIKEEDSQKIVAGAILLDNAYLKDMEHLANIYFIFPNSFFEFDLPPAAQSIDNIQFSDDFNDKELQGIYVYDKDINHIYSTVPTTENVLSNMPIDITQKIYETESGYMEINHSQKKYILLYNTSTEFAWKFIRLVPYASYYKMCTHIINMTILIFATLFLLWCVLNYFVVKKIVSPIRDIVHAMKCVENENLDVTLKIQSKDEFYTIGKHFNHMIIKIKELLERVRIEEQKRKESDILMMEYQMNPHFLYNTLAAIRMVTLSGDHEKAADMLLILGRFLKNAISKCTKTIRVEDEILNIKDYISIMQIRYDNQIKTNINICEDVKQMLIPSMLLQPIIENSLIHGLSDKFDTDMDACIDINIRKTDETIILSVRDNGKGMSEFEREMIMEMLSSETTGYENENHHIGLRNAHRRLITMFGNDYGISIESTPGEYTRVNITLPIIYG